MMLNKEYEGMNNFMIGQYGSFDFNKYVRDFKDGFFGIEACLFKSRRDIEYLAGESRSKGFEIGIHFPLRAGVSKLRDPLFLSLNSDVKKAAFQYAEDEMKFIKEAGINPHYILFHYPKPVILTEDADWVNWHFSDSSEYIFESKYGFDDFKAGSEYLFDWLSQKGEQYEFTPVLEFDALNKYICGSSMLEELLNRYGSIKLCLDTGRLHMQDWADPHFSSIDIIKRFASYCKVVHLWNVKVSDTLENYHYPALPDLNPAEGWADIEEYLGIIKDKNKDVKIMFEHRSDLINDRQLENCYSWIESIMCGSRLKL